MTLLAAFAATLAVSYATQRNRTIRRDRVAFARLIELGRAMLGPDHE